MPVTIVLQAQIDQAVRALDQVRREQLPFATSLAVNWTALATQADIRKNVRGSFILRRPTFILNTIKIEKYDFSTKKNPTTFRVKVDDGKNKRGARKDVLAKFEAGGLKVRPDRVWPFIIPSSGLRPNVRDLVPRSMYPTALRLAPSRGVVGVSYERNAKGNRIRLFGTLPAQQKRTKRGVLQWRGKRRTFILDPQEHFGVKTWGVYQRTGPRKEDVKLLWTYRARLPIPARLRFVQTAEESVEREFARNFARAYSRAVATAR